MKITVHHAHIFQGEVRKDATISALQNVMDECGIDGAVCFAPFDDYFISNGESQNRWLYEQIKNKDQFLAFGTIDFTKDNLKEQVEEIHQLGFAGIKMHPAYQRVKTDGDRACQVYEVAEKYGLPISFHTGIHRHRLADYHMLLFDEVVYRFPELKICLEHVGGYAYFNEAMGVVNNNPNNVYAGLTSVFDDGPNRFWYLGKEKVKDIIWLSGIEKCIFGLDFPYNQANEIKDAMRMMRECIDELGLGDEGAEKVFGGNLMNMIGNRRG